MINFFKNVSFTFIANLMVAVISILSSIILPKYISIENYGYFQLYLFYITYTCFTSFGWTDGVFLKYGGSFYHSLNKPLLGTQFKIFTFFQIIFCAIFCFAVAFWENDKKREIVFFFVGIYIILSQPTSFLRFILQGTNRIKEYAFSIIIERFVFGIGIFAIIVLGYDNFIYPIICFCLGLFASTIYSLVQCKELLQSHFNFNKNIFKEILSNINIGSKIMLAYAASLLIIGIVRWAIEKKWDISTFGKVSLTLYISNIMMIFIRSVSSVMLPSLRRIDSQKYASLYNDIKMILLALMFGGLTLYYPLNVVLTIWLPNYADGLKFMAILFPLCIFEGKLSVLVEMYLKTMRLEKKILTSNIASLVFSVIATFASVFVLENLSIAVTCILVIFAFRTTLGEYLLSKHLNINFYRNIVVEMALVVIFVCSSWLVGGIKGLLIYCSAYVVFWLIYRKKIMSVIRKWLLKK